MAAKNRETLKRILYISGTLIVIFGFFGDHTEELPFVLKLVAPTYYHAKEGVNTLEKTHELKPSEDGYAEISLLLTEYAKNIAANNSAPISKEVLGAIQIKKITYSGAFGWGGDQLPGTAIQFTVGATKFFPEKQLGYRMETLKEQVQESKKVPTRNFCLSVFILGLLVGFIGYKIDTTEPEHKHPHRPKKKSFP